MNLNNMQEFLSNSNSKIDKKSSSVLDDVGREKQLKNAIDGKFPCHSADVTGNYQRQIQRRIGTYIALSTPSILRHCDPEIMKQAGWVREEEYNKLKKDLEQAFKEIDTLSKQ